MNKWLVLNEYLLAGRKEERGGKEKKRGIRELCVCPPFGVVGRGAAGEEGVPFFYHFHLFCFCVIAAASQ